MIYKSELPSGYYFAGLFMSRYKCFMCVRVHVSGLFLLLFKSSLNSLLQVPPCVNNTSFFPCCKSLSVNSTYDFVSTTGPRVGN